jgi:hypothetical protein
LRSRFSKALAVIAALHLMGGHWIAVQSVAWVTMIVDYAEDSSVTEALAKTFDGQHPCQICKAVASGKEQERESRGSQGGSLELGAKLLAVLSVQPSSPPLSGSKLRYFEIHESPTVVETFLLSPPPWGV